MTKLNHRPLCIAIGILFSASTAVAGAQSFDKAMHEVLKPYLKVQRTLATDSTAGVKDAAAAILKAAKRLDVSSVTGEHKSHYKNVPRDILSASQTLSAAKDIKQARDAFKKLSKPMAMWASMAKPHGTYVMFCSMANGSWLQDHEAINNPYYGSEMLACGENVGGNAKHSGHHGKHH